MRGDGIAPSPSGESKVHSFRESETESVSESGGVCLHRGRSIPREPAGSPNVAVADSELAESRRS